jgi:adenylate cyclase
MPRARADKSAKIRKRSSSAPKKTHDQRAGELKEALEQQRATAEVLKAISSSTFNLQTVLDVLTESAARLCNAYDVLIMLREDDLMAPRSHYGPIPIISENWRLSRDWTPGRAVLDRKTIHVRDLMVEEVEFPRGHAGASRMGYRTVLSIPLMREKAEPLGALLLRRMEVRPFTARQIELAESFSAQAVIAIENARLLNELRHRTDDLSEALEQQTGMSEVLRVISASPGALQPVFEAMLENATRICEAKFGNLFLREGDSFRIGAMRNLPSRYAEWWSNEPVVHLREHPHAPLTRLARTKSVLHIADLTTDPGYLERDPRVLALVDTAGARTLLLVPMLKDDVLIGSIVIYRTEVRPFSDKQIELLTNFATQAVIAVENTRLLNELRGKTNELAQLNEQLEKRVSDQVAEIERMGRLRRFLPPQVADLIVSTGAEKQLESHRREITALFCDLRGFTGFSESADPEDVMSLLQEYHAAIGRIIFKHGGTLERFVGDGVMVIFNDPIPLENPSLHAVQMALEMRAAIGALVETWHRLGHEIGFGIGIAHGYATLGTIGFEGRFDYAAVGTVSNVASRLCDEAKPGQILISSRVLTAIEGAVTVEPAGELTLKGIRRPLEVYNVVGAADELHQGASEAPT